MNHLIYFFIGCMCFSCSSDPTCGALNMDTITDKWLILEKREDPEGNDISQSSHCPEKDRIRFNSNGTYTYDSYLNPALCDSRFLFEGGNGPNSWVYMDNEIELKPIAIEDFYTRYFNICVSDNSIMAAFQAFDDNMNSSGTVEWVIQ